MTAAMHIFKRIRSYFKRLGFQWPFKTLCKLPVADGSFIQSDMVLKWDDTRWLREFGYLREAGMHYLVLMGVSTTEGDTVKMVYPTRIQGCRMMENCNDVVDCCLKNAQKDGIRVFIGMNYNEEWWQKEGNDPAWLYAQMERGNLIADELFSLYHAKYPEAFYGWYWPYEVDNLNFQTKKQFSVLAQAIDIQLRHLKAKNERLPFMLSPFVNGAYSSPGAYAKGWASVFANTDLGEGDIFCPQDSIGGGGLDLKTVKPWFVRMKKAVKSKPGLSFWANVENFDHTNWSSATLDRFVKQLQIEQRYADNMITFSYSHYYSPNNIDGGFHRMYLNYIREGRLEKLRPAPPVNVKVKQLCKHQFLITWKPSKDSMNIYGYRVYRNGEMVFSTCLQRKYGGNQEGLSTSFNDTLKPAGVLTPMDTQRSPDPLKSPDGSPVRIPNYGVCAFDFAGNQSEIREPLLIAMKSSGA